MTDGLVVGRDLILGLGLDWEEALIAAAQRHNLPPGTISLLPPGEGASADVQFIVYPAVAHSNVASANLLAERCIDVPASAKVVVIACDLVDPGLSSEEVLDCAKVQLSGTHSHFQAFWAPQVTDFESYVSRVLAIRTKEMHMADPVKQLETSDVLEAGSEEPWAHLLGQ